MDKNSIYGLLIIGGILVGSLYLAQPSKEELAKRQQIQDSIHLYQEVQKTSAEAAAKSTQNKLNPALALSKDSTVSRDSINAIIKNQQYGGFADASSGINKIITLENEVMKVNLATKGGRIASVELKKYKTSLLSRV